MKTNKFFIFIIIFFLSINLSVKADIPHFLDFKYVLNNSEAGKKAQNFLQNKLTKGLENLKKKEKEIQNNEKKIIQQKKVLSPEDYKKQVNELRSSVSSLQKERNNLLETVSKQRSSARNELLRALNPIIKDYMNEKKIRMVIDKKSLLLADENLDITKEITSRLNKKLKSIKLK